MRFLALFPTFRATSLLVCLVAIYLTGYSSAQFGGPQWGYLPGTGPDTWPALCQSGTKQSPIDIPSTRHLERVRDWEPIRLIRYDDQPRFFKIFNTGRHASMTVHMKGCEPSPSIMGGGLGGSKYEVGGIKFHWGSERSRGSEHTIDTKRYSMEMQIVHYNLDKGFDFYSAAYGYNGGSAADDIAILSVLIEVGEYNHAFEGIIHHLREIRDQRADFQGSFEGDGDGDVKFDAVPLRKLLPKNTDSFFRYEGSFTDPEFTSCGETATWTIFKEPIQLSYDQMSEFWKLRTDVGDPDGQPLINNFRPIQALNDRTVYDAELNYRFDDDCHKDYRRGWLNRNGHFEWKETEKEYNFMESIHECIEDSYHHTFAGLMTLGKLRHFKNFYGSGPREDHFCHGRFFRVNAIKDSFGEWREFPSGRIVHFTHFPEFRPNHGGEGDTLIWDAHYNRLYIDDKGDKRYHALCYRQDEKPCDRCAGFERGEECSDAGDCRNHECVCDDGFSGHSCQIPPIPDKDIIHAFGEYNSFSTNHINSGTTFIYHQRSKLMCSPVSRYHSRSSATDFMKADYIFGRSIMCGGVFTGPTTVQPVASCVFYQCKNDMDFDLDYEYIYDDDSGYTSFEDIPDKIGWPGTNIVQHNNRDVYWWHTGGLRSQILQGTQNFTGSIATYLLDEDMRWERGEDLPERRAGHCQVQINDCEVALMGGAVGDNTIGEFTSLNGTKSVIIYNFKTKMWRSGPDMLEDRFLQSCGRVWDRSNDHLMVVTACSDSPTGAQSDTVEIWDTVTNEIYYSKHTCPSGINRGNFKEMGDRTHLAWLDLNGDNSYYTFELEGGFNKLHQVFTSDPDIYDGGSLLAPRGAISCFGP